MEFSNDVNHLARTLRFIDLPTDILNCVIQPTLYHKDILQRYFRGDPDSGLLMLKEPWDAPHLSIISQLKTADEMSKLNKDLATFFPHPLKIPYKEKIKFAKESIKDMYYSNNTNRKIAYKIANRIKPNNLNRIIEMIEGDYTNKVRYNRYLVLHQLKEKIELKAYHYSNDTCLHCEKRLPTYTPSIRKYWKRCIMEGYSPHALLKRTCSKRCLKNNLNVFICSNCEKTCKPGTDFYIGNLGYTFTIVQINPITSEATLPVKVLNPYLTNFACSVTCYNKLVDFGASLNNRYLLIRNDALINGAGFIFDDEVIDALRENLYVIKNSVIVLNPDAEEFIPVF